MDCLNQQISVDDYVTFGTYSMSIGKIVSIKYENNSSINYIVTNTSYSYIELRDFQLVKIPSNMIPINKIDDIENNITTVNKRVADLKKKKEELDKNKRELKKNMKPGNCYKTNRYNVLYLGKYDGFEHHIVFTQYNNIIRLPYEFYIKQKSRKTVYEKIDNIRLIDILNSINNSSYTARNSSEVINYIKTNFKKLL